MRRIESQPLTAWSVAGAAWRTTAARRQARLQNSSRPMGPSKSPNRSEATVTDQSPLPLLIASASVGARWRLTAAPTLAF
jgi:hypothetical protein